LTYRVCPPKRAHERPVHADSNPTSTACVTCDCPSDLQLDHDHAQNGLADVLERVRRQRLGPQGGRRPGRPGTRSSVQSYTPVAVVANEVGAAQHVLNVRPAVRVDRRRVAGLNARLENPDALVLDEHVMVSWCGNHRIQRVRPLPLRVLQI
jgi:hypothetical protein